MLWKVKLYFSLFFSSLNKVILFWSPFPVLWFQAIEPIRKWALKYSATRKRSVGIPLILETKTKKPNAYFPIDTGFTLLWLSPGLTEARHVHVQIGTGFEQVHDPAPRSCCSSNMCWVYSFFSWPLFHRVPGSILDIGDSAVSKTEAHRAQNAVGAR